MANSNAAGSVRMRGRREKKGGRGEKKGGRGEKEGRGEERREELSNK